MTRRAVLAQARVEILLTLRRGESLVVSFLIPIGILVFFTKVDAVNTLRRPVDFLVPPAAIHCIRERGLYAQGR